jgi:DNA-binding NtrC family response regulator
MNSSNEIKILYVDDEPVYCNIFRRMLIDDEQYTVYTAENGEKALEILSTEKVDAVFTDLLMPGMSGIELVERIIKNHGEMFISVITSLDSSAEAVKAIKSGASDYILKPFDVESIRLQIENISRQKAIETETFADEDNMFSSFVGKSDVMSRLFEQIKQIAETDTTVLVYGESGTGKELIAESIHIGSRRSNGKFIRVNCAALTDSLLSSTLFGYEKGAFTGASSRKKGLFEAASGGTIFLDEIGDIPAQTQAALLRVLEQGTFQRVGGTESVKVDVRIICATNKNLSEDVVGGSFREDLFYRINVVTLTAPALRERPSDIPLLAQFFMDRFKSETGKDTKYIDPEVISILSEYSWPGNVRELRNTIEHAVVFCKGDRITKENLPQKLQLNNSEKFSIELKNSSLMSAEEALIRAVLEQHQWNMSRAADALNIARGTLYSKLKKLGISKP